jgi:adenine nucleotide transporter 17
MNPNASHDPNQPQTVVVKKLGFFETIQNILAKDGVGAFWRGLGPALVLVINPVIQYTVFEQLKNFLVQRRTSKLRAGGIAAAVAVLSDWDYFFLGALSKLGKLHFVVSS